MELAIPFIALAGAYVISNQSTNSDRSQRIRTNDGVQRIQEGMSNGGMSNGGMSNGGNVSNGKGGGRTELPNTNVPVENYPVINANEVDDNVQYYSNPNTATDKYFNQNLYETKQNAGKKVGNNIQEVYSLTGDYMNSKEFKHNNMVPFYGGKIKGQVYDMNVSETVLDNMVGTGSQTIHKVEQAPLFKPQSNMQWANGAPNMSDFYQSRVNPAKNNAMVKPFESEHVGPGLNQGYGTSGSGGFNSGMESRDSWLPKTVDELRVDTNPKMEYSLENHEGPSYSRIQNSGIIGKVEKYHPDTFFINTQDRWLTTTGQEKGQALRPVQEDKDTSRSVLTQSYSGVAGATEKNRGYTSSSYTEPKRPELAANDVPSSHAVGRGSTMVDKDNYLKSHTNYNNNRSTVRQADTYRSSFSGAIGAVIAPLMDVFRPTKKDEYGSNIRLYGDAGSKVAQSYVKNMGDAPAATIKQSTMYAPDSYIGNQSSAGQVINNHQAVANQRDTTTGSYVGSSGGAGVRRGTVQVDAAYRQYNNDKLETTQGSYTPQGGTQIYNQQMHVNVARIDGDRENPRMWVPQMTTTSQMPANKEMYGKMTTRQMYDDNKIGTDRIQPDLLDSFRKNPFTHSLTDCV